MSDLPARIDIQEEGPREGFQIADPPIATDRKIALIDALTGTGLKEIQVASFVDPRRVPGWADAEAVVAGITPRPGVRHTALWLNERGLERAIATGRLHLKALASTSASEPFLKRNQNQDFAANAAMLARNLARYRELGLTQVRLGVMASFGCNFAGEITPAQVVEAVARVQRLIDEVGLETAYICLADTMAWGNPESIRRVVGAVRERWPSHRIALHLHDTRGLAVANAYAGLQMGVDSFDASVAGLGGCPFAGHKGAAGNICTEDLVFLCHELGIETGVDLEALLEAARLAEEIFDKPLPGSVMHGGSLAAIRKRLAA